MMKNENQTMRVVVTSSTAILKLGCHAEVIDLKDGTYFIKRAGTVNNHTKLRSTNPMSLFLREGEFTRLS